MSLVLLWMWVIASTRLQSLQGIGLQQERAREEAFSNTLIHGSPSTKSRHHVPSIGYAITITSCGPYNDTMLHAATAVARMVQNISARPDNDFPNYRLHAFCDPIGVSVGCQTILKRLNYTVWTLPNPVNETLVQEQSERYYKYANTNGCCGLSEFLKLYAYTLTKHDAVVHLDVDVVLIKPMNDVFQVLIHQDQEAYRRLDRISPPPRRGPDEEQGHDDTPLSSIQAFITKDYTAAETLTNRQLLFSQNDTNKLTVQGGFFVVRPNQTVFREMVRIVETESVHYTSGGSWNNTMNGAMWGAPQIQGLLGYYYSFVAADTAIELHPCFYNNIMASPTYDNRNGPKCMIPFQSPCPDCRKTPVDSVFVAHPIFCFKPWQCTHWKDQERFIRSAPCRQYLHRWSSAVRDSEYMWIESGLEWNAQRIDDSVLMGDEKESYLLPHVYRGYCLRNRTFVPLEFQENSLLPKRPGLETLVGT